MNIDVNQNMFEEMQNALRHDVIRSLFHARPVDSDELDSPIETELTRAARSSVDNADRILDVEAFDEDDFSISKSKSAENTLGKNKNVVKKKRKAQRQNKKKNRHK